MSGDATAGTKLAMLARMQSRYDETEAQTYVDEFSAKAPAELVDAGARRDLALRVYTSRLLGREPSLVLHGGGNTSVKTQAREYSGRLVECLCVKGSGWDLASIEPAGFPACRLEPLIELCRLDALSDEDMVKGLRSQMLDPTSPTPSVEALLHAYLPAKFVDHTHADAVLALVDQPDAEAHVRRVWGSEALFVPYIMPGFVLLKRVVELTRDKAIGSPLVLEKHGIFTFGATAAESYERMIDAVTRADQYLAARGAALEAVPAMLSRPPLAEPERRAGQRLIAPILRGALTRAPEGRPFLLRWQDDAATLELLSRPDAATLTQEGPLTPDHVIRTKPRPLFVPTLSLGDTGALRAELERLLAEYAKEYRAYFERGVQAHSARVERLDALPRVVLFPQYGAACLGQALDAAGVVADIYQHTAQVVLSASRLGHYRPVNELDLFEVEYWSLEQAKLKHKKASGVLVGRIALVTGAARGIGLTTARRLLEAGAHVVVSDLEPEPLRSSTEKLSAEFGDSRVRQTPADVTIQESAARAVEFCIDTFGGLDLVISNAGTAPSGLLHEPEGDAALRRSLEVNLLGHQNIATVAGRLMIEQGSGGTLLFNASKSAFNQGPEFGPYAVPKAALVSLMKQYAVDLARYGIRSNAVNADRVRTDLFGGGVLEARAKARGVSADDYFKLNLLGRETTAEDVADAFLWLATAEATTGAVVTVDGGNAAAFPR